MTATMASGSKTATATCTTGTVIGGGFRQTDNKQIVESGPSGANGWTVTVDANLGAGKTGTVTAYCAA